MSCRKKMTLLCATTLLCGTQMKFSLKPKQFPDEGQSPIKYLKYILLISSTFRDQQIDKMG